MINTQFKSTLLILFITAGKMLLAQDILTPEDAIGHTLENNFGIKIAQQNISLATNNATKTAVGYNPTVNATAGTSGNVGSSTQKFGNGNENVVSNALSFNGSANVSGAYTLYDQTRNTTLEQLREILNFSNLQLRQTIELNVLQLISRYYEVARLTSTIAVLDQTLAVSNRRLERVQYQYEYGQGVRLDILNAEVDVQRDSINLINIKQSLANAKRDLNVIMGVPIENTFEVDTSV
ncbi:MAG: TolC family protein, partial [Saprospiraceae bacterium]|nr:TolC family protein [Saprospiraceae bacterium]